MLRRSFCIVSVILFVSCVALAHDHTHFGINADGVWGNGDDNQLWIFATPSQPQWGTLEMLPTGDYIGGKQVYAATLDCWHTAHPDNGSFQLGGYDQLVMPDWRISLKRIDYSDDLNFWQEVEATGDEILTYDGATFSFGEPIWMADKYNESGTLGAWGIHYHIEFLATAVGAGEIFTATFSVLDAGSTGYLESAPYTFTFVTVPEPTTLALLGAGLVSVLRRRRK